MPIQLSIWLRPALVVGQENNACEQGTIAGLLCAHKSHPLKVTGSASGAQDWASQKHLEGVTGQQMKGEGATVCVVQEQVTTKQQVEESY